MGCCDSRRDDIAYYIENDHGYLRFEPGNYENKDDECLFSRFNDLVKGYTYERILKNKIKKKFKKFLAFLLEKYTIGARKRSIAIWQKCCYENRPYSVGTPYLKDGFVQLLYNKNESVSSGGINFGKIDHESHINEYFCTDNSIANIDYDDDRFIVEYLSVKSKLENLEYIIFNMPQELKHYLAYHSKSVLNVDKIDWVSEKDRITKYFKINGKKSQTRFESLITKYKCNSHNLLETIRAERRRINDIYLDKKKREDDEKAKIENERKRQEEIRQQEINNKLQRDREIREEQYRLQKQREFEAIKKREQEEYNQKCRKSLLDAIEIIKKYENDLLIDNTTEFLNDLNKKIIQICEFLNNGSLEYAQLMKIKTLIDKRLTENDITKTTSALIEQYSILSTCLANNDLANAERKIDSAKYWLTYANKYPQCLQLCSNITTIMTSLMASLNYLRVGQAIITSSNAKSKDMIDEMRNNAMKANNALFDENYKLRQTIRETAQRYSRK